MLHMIFIGKRRFLCIKKVYHFGEMLQLYTSFEGQCQVVLAELIAAFTGINHSSLICTAKKNHKEPFSTISTPSTLRHLNKVRKNSKIPRHGKKKKLQGDPQRKDLSPRDRQFTRNNWPSSDRLFFLLEMTQEVSFLMHNGIRSSLWYWSS